jgi:hypothetical protein
MHICVEGYCTVVALWMCAGMMNHLRIINIAPLNMTFIDKPTLKTKLILVDIRLLHRCDWSRG